MMVRGGNCYDNYVSLYSSKRLDSCLTLIINHLFLADDETQGNNSNDGAPALSDEEIKMEAQKWVQRSKYGSTVVFGLWAAWIVFFQLSKDRFGPNWFVRTEDEGEFTGW